jgi:outer membrane immunogenic protein
MKKTFLTIGMLLLIGVIFAQGKINKGQKQLNAGFGFSNRGLPIYVGFDYGISPDVSLGAEFSYRSYNENIVVSKYNHSVIGFLGNANYHFNSVLKIPSPWDLYAGLNIGFISISSPNGYTGSYSSGLGLGAQFGGRYYFNKKLGINLEFGGGNQISGGKFGITLKL